MVKRVHERITQKTGNMLRTILIWVGALLALAAGLLLMGGVVSEKVAVYFLVATAIVYGFVLLDFDVDDDD
jgi:UPF0716 family protein affecting phage T7 exclusion